MGWGTENFDSECKKEPDFEKTNPKRLLPIQNEILMREISKFWRFCRKNVSFRQALSTRKIGQIEKILALKWPPGSHLSDVTIHFDLNPIAASQFTFERDHTILTPKSAVFLKFEIVISRKVLHWFCWNLYQRCVSMVSNGSQTGFRRLSL